MENNAFFSQEEALEIKKTYNQIRENPKFPLSNEDEQKVYKYLKEAIEQSSVVPDVFGLNPILHGLQVALLSIEELDLTRDGFIALFLYVCISSNKELATTIGKEFDGNVESILHGLFRVQELYKKSPIIETENFRHLLLSFAEDMRVVLIMIAERVSLMRQIKDSPNDDARRQVSTEALYLYAPLAHKLGLYKLKSELEDLSLKYLEHDAYYMIKAKLNATKQSRDAYIDNFIAPVKKRLEEAGLVFHMKGRTKSIHSIWQKMKKQQCEFEGIYDLFAIRIIIDSPLEKEKMQCWQAYSIVTDMYQPNPKRLRDWLSIPKSNGYESLHITVLGPENKWVEVQIRTQRMDEVAEKGLAAHWRYKGIKSETGAIDDWLNNIRTALEHNDDRQLMDQFRLNLSTDEVYVFTPKGDLYKFPKGATVLDFAYHIHSAVGNSCMGAKINGRVVQIREVLHSGDTVEIITQANQRPKFDWLQIVKTPRAKAKLRLALKETQQQESLLAKEMIERKFKNRKIEYNESVMSQTIKKMGFKNASEFYKQISASHLDVNDVIDKYLEIVHHEQNQHSQTATRSAGGYSLSSAEPANNGQKEDILIIDSNLKGIDYSLAKCCNPIYGDPILGFVTVNGGIKVHHKQCPNVPELRKRFGYRIINARWSGKGNSLYGVTLRVVGHDDIGIVNNLTSIITKEDNISLRSINIDSHDGVFNGNLTIQLEDTSKLENLLKKLRTVKGVKQITRI